MHAHHRQRQVKRNDCVFFLVSLVLTFIDDRKSVEKKQMRIRLLVHRKIPLILSWSCAKEEEKRTNEKRQQKNKKVKDKQKQLTHFSLFLRLPFVKCDRTKQKKKLTNRIEYENSLFLLDARSRKGDETSTTQEHKEKSHFNSSMACMCVSVCKTLSWHQSKQTQFNFASFRSHRQFDSCFRSFFCMWKFICHFA